MKQKQQNFKKQNYTRKVANDLLLDSVKQN